MSDPVELSVRSSLSKIIDELAAIRDRAMETQQALKTAGQATDSAMTGAAGKAKKVGAAFKESGDEVEEGLGRNVKRTEKFFAGLRSLSRRVADQLRGDFKSLLSINAVSDSLKLSNQFRGSISETVQLSDAIRKLGATFGIAGKDFQDFQENMTKGLGEIGMASDVGGRVMNGLSTTRVRGQEQIIDYSRTAGMLGSVGQEQGQEGAIAKALANVIQARGGNVNSKTEVDQLAEAVRRVFVETGAAPTATLRSMEDIFKNMPEDFRKTLTPNGLTNLAAASAVGGPGATKFLEEYLGKSPIARQAFDAQGGRGVFTDKGIDIEKFKGFAQSIMGRVGGDPRLAAQTLGLSEEAAEGFVRLARNLDKVKEAQERVTTTAGSLSEQYRSSMGFAESFRANINRVKKALASPLSFITQKGTDLLSGAAQSDAGAGAVVAGGGLLAMLLAGAGLKGIGGGLGKVAGGALGTVARTKGAEAVLGKETIPVYVTNASEIGGGVGGGLGGIAGGAAGAAEGGGMGLMGKAGMVGVAGIAGYAIGAMLAPMFGKFLTENTNGKTDEGFEGDAAERFFFKIGKLFGMEGTGDENYNHLDPNKPEDATPVHPPSELNAWKPYMGDVPAADKKKLQENPRGHAAEGARSDGIPKVLQNILNTPGHRVGPPQQTVKVIVEAAPKDFKISKQPTRGASN